MDVAGAVDGVRVDKLATQVPDRARHREHRPVPLARKHDREARRASRVDGEPGHVHPDSLELIAHEPSEQIVADDPRERHAKAEPRCSAGEDAAGSAEHQACVVDEVLDLPERRHEIAPPHDQIRVGVPQDEQVDLLHAATIAACLPAS